MLPFLPDHRADESAVPANASGANSSTALSGRASGTRVRKKMPRSMITDLTVIRWAVAPRFPKQEEGRERGEFAGEREEPEELAELFGSRTSHP
jgi:hypothetical protein